MKNKMKAESKFPDPRIGDQHGNTFGSINIETGEIYNGKMVGDKMTFNLDIWKSIKNKIKLCLFGNPYKQKSVKLKPKIEIIGDTNHFTINRFSGQKVDRGDCPIYREYDIDSGQTLKIWTVNPYNKKYFFNIDVWEQTQTFVRI